MTENTQPITYAGAGVDVEAGDLAVELMKAAVKSTHSTSVLGGFGGFAGMWDASALTSYRKPILTTSTDGVGTKVAIAQSMDIHHTIGQDLVGMVVDDIVVVGAKPLFMTDYIATGKVVPDRIADIVRGIAEGCALANTALIGGETAEHPGLLAEHEYDVAGAVTGVVEADSILGPDRVKAGDVVIAMGSSGIHSNGYSLVRRVVEANGWTWDRHIEEFGRSLGEELLTPTKIYAGECLGLVNELNTDPNNSTDSFAVRGFSHITGGGLAANLARVLPPGLMATVDRSTWSLPKIFRTMQQAGNIPQADLERTLNLGIGMVAVLAPESADTALNWLNAHGSHAWHIGTIGEQPEDAASAGTDFIQGAKGVNGGSVLMRGKYAD